MVVVVPAPNTEPGAGPAVRVVTAPGQLSVPTGGVQLPTAPDGQVGSSVWLDGQLITGFSTSFTVTVNEQDVLFPLVSVTSKVFVVVPTGKVEPLGRPAVCAVVAPGQLSEPTGVV